MNKSDIMKVAANAYYMNSNMIKFLLVENLALKTLLHEKGLITPEEYKLYQEKAASILSIKEEHQMLEFLKKSIDSNGSSEDS